MRRVRTGLVLLLACFQACRCVVIFASEPPAPVITNLSVSAGQLSLRFPLYPAAQAYKILSTPDLSFPLVPDTNFFLTANVYLATNGVTTVTNVDYEWRSTNHTGPSGFFRLGVTPVSSNVLLAATVLNRLAYGPTPDELTRILSIGPQAYIDEQLAPWSLNEDVANTHPNVSMIQAKFCEATNFVYSTNATISDLRAWHALRAVGARRQLLEILLQFLENHFVTQWSKSWDYFDTYFDDGNLMDILATKLEYMENENWRNALLNPQCTFYDLLKISSESPAMIIYLDTVGSKGNGNKIANENYARELLELMTMGVNNGYDQNDVTALSRAWTGWTVQIVDFANAFSPFAPQTVTIIPGSTNTSTSDKANLYGVWAFNFNIDNHNSNPKTIFQDKFVPARFGLPWTANLYASNSLPGRYELLLNNGARNTIAIRDGYQVVSHLANLPFTEEYISIKLCRLFVHDDFPNPSSDTNSPAYGFYNYAAGNLSPEAELVHQCMLTWENSQPKGQIWAVLRTIFNSELFRTQSASMQKVKTPFEYIVSVIRALRSSTNGSNLAGSFTAFTDGYSLAGTATSPPFPAPLARMGNMLLFDRDSPDGYPEAGPPWISAGTLAERTRFVQSFCIAAGQPGHSGTPDSLTNDASGSVCNVVGLLKSALPSSSWTNASAVVDYFLGILYPSEGAANLQLYRQAALDFLNDGSADTPASATKFDKLSVSAAATSAYDQRVRGMVGMLLAMRRFDEQ